MSRPQNNGLVEFVDERQGRHTRPRGFLGDMEKYNAATVMGWRVVRTTPDKLVSAQTLAMLREMCR